MILSMYVTLAELFNDAANDNHICVVLWHGAGDSLHELNGPNFAHAIVTTDELLAAFPGA